MPKILQPALIQKTNTVTVTVTPAPITKVGDTSTAATTTYTATTVVDGTAWDLSAGRFIAVGDVVKAGGYQAVVDLVSDGTNTLRVKGWMPPGGGGQDPRAASVKPADGVAATIHKISRAKLITITATPGNTQDIYVGLDETARTTDYPLQAGASLPIEGDLDVTRIYVRSASGSQSAEWIVGGSVSGNTATSINLSGPLAVTWRTFVIGDTTPDVSTSSTWITNNTGATTIINFDNPPATGQLLWIIAGDGNTTIQNNADIKLQGGNDFGPMATNDALLLAWQGSLWLELGRSLNS